MAKNFVIDASADWQSALANGEPLPKLSSDVADKVLASQAAAHHVYGRSDSACARFTMDSLVRQLIVDEINRRGHSRDKLDALRNMRIDAAEGETSLIDVLDEVGFRSDGMRQDAPTFADNSAMAFRDELVEVIGEIIRQRRRVRDSEALFGRESTLSVGKKEYEIRAVQRRGNARVWREGVDIPLQSFGVNSERRPIRHLVAGWEQTFFDRIQGQHLDLDEVREKSDEAVEQLLDLADHLFWHGSEDDDLYGILTYPWFPRRTVPGITFQSETVMANWIAMLNALHEVANFGMISNQGQVKLPSRMIISPRMQALMSQVKDPTNFNISLMQAFRDGQPLITGVQTSPNLQGTGPGGTDGIMFFEDERSQPRLVQPQGITPLPIMDGAWGLSRRQAMYMTVGGARFIQLLGGVMAWVTVNYGQ